MPPALPIPQFRLRYVSGEANLDVATYNRTTAALTVTAAAAGRISITTTASQVKFSIGVNPDVLVINDSGLVVASKITERQDLTSPRIDFVCRPDSVWRRIASINALGLLWAPKFNEEVPTTSLDQIRFFTLAAILLNKGFIADTFQEA